MMIPMLIGWIIGVPLTIWWPRPKSPEHPGQTRALGKVRLAAGCMILSTTFYMAVEVAQLVHQEGWLAALSTAFVFGAFLLSPLASCASSLDVQRRGMAIVGSYLAVVTAGGQFWFSALTLLVLIYLDPYSPLWWRACMIVSAVFAAVALFLVLELYALVRRPTDP
jgi:hypothetical protein